MQNEKDLSNKTCRWKRALPDYVTICAPSWAAILKVGVGHRCKPLANGNWISQNGNERRPITNGNIHHSREMICRDSVDAWKALWCGPQIENRLLATNVHTNNALSTLAHRFSSAVSEELAKKTRDGWKQPSFYNRITVIIDLLKQASVCFFPGGSDWWGVHKGFLPRYVQ